MLTTLTLKLKGYIPDFIYNQIPGVLSFGIDGLMRLSNMLGQAAHESQNFTHFTENLNYSGPVLWELFHTHFKDSTEAMSFAHQPERIANRIYSNRLGNSDEASGDGWYHRGVGAIQLTGKSNQEVFFVSMGLPANSDPQLIAATYQLASAAYFFKVNNLWSICDGGVDIPTITTITKHVNGGELGLSQRIQYTQNFYHILTT